MASTLLNPPQNIIAKDPINKMMVAAIFNVACYLWGKMTLKTDTVL